MPQQRSSTTKGTTFEKRVHDYFAAEIGASRFWAKKTNCRLYWKKPYHSRDRNSKITFDIAIELYLPRANEYSSVVLVECKDYSGSIPVDDIEEFYAKVQQVGAANAKAVFVSTAGFQKGAREFARSKGIGLMRFFAPTSFKWELKRSPSATARSTSAEDAHLVDVGLSQSDFVSTVFDWYLQSPIRDTNSLWDFFDDLVRDSGLPPDRIRLVTNSRSKVTNRVPFLEKDEFEAKSADILADIGYSGAEVDLSVICDREKRAARLVVKTEVDASLTQRAAAPLGRITFTPLVIEIFRAEQPHRARERFTLAHELAHHLLNHGKFMTREFCDEDDFVLHRRPAIGSSDVARLEFQANYFASSLLMPRAYFLEDFHRLARKLDISDHGFGALYLDEQPCNIQTFLEVTNRLMLRYGVSRTSAKIRLESLGLLNDASQLRSTRSALKLFSFTDQD